MIEIASEHFEGLPNELRDAINDRLRRAFDQLEASVGLRGPVHQAADLSLGDKVITGIQDPTKDADLINFQTLKRWSTCEHLTRVLEQCNEHALLVQDLAEELGGAAQTVPWAWAQFVVTTPDPGAGIAYTANQVRVCPMFLMYNINVQNATFEVTTAGAAGTVARIGIYDSNKDRIAQTGLIAVDATGARSGSIAAELVPGQYLIAFTCDGAPSLRILPSTGAFGLESVINNVTNRAGLDAASVGAALPATLGTLTGSNTQLPLILFDEIA